MIIPVRCFACGKVTGNLWNKYKEMLKSGISSDKALDDLGLRRICCRRILFTHVNMIDHILEYQENKIIVKTEN